MWFWIGVSSNRPYLWLDVGRKAGKNSQNQYGCNRQWSRHSTPLVIPLIVRGTQLDQMVKPLSGQELRPNMQIIPHASDALFVTQVLTLICGVSCVVSTL
ncbi:hypothetical protein RRG08_020130 [Elysia crispata]|uniref:Uncharacterized protein n=1 Tax=Elysia crispata TaxID=231223 RepID=A0AAE1A5T5_9GAST|nr:hypothetical protein RRG08_020130 [Elysia crispata]